MKRRPARVASSIGLVGGLALLCACNQREKQEPLQHAGPKTKVESARPGYEPNDTDSNLTPPKEFRRTDVEMEGRGGLHAKAEVEEVMQGVRFAIWLDDAKPGTYDVVVFDSGSCDEDPSAWGERFRFAGVETSANQGEKPVLGQVEVQQGGDGTARWLTSRGNLRSQGNDSLVGKLVVLFPSETAEGPGKPLACGTIDVDLK